MPRPRWYPYVEATVGAIVDSRRLAFHPSTPPAYRPGTGGGVHVDVTLYPFAWSHALLHGVFAGLGGGVTVDKPFWPTTQFEGTPNQYATAELRVEGGARWRFIVRKWRPRLEVTVLGGAGLHRTPSPRRPIRRRARRSTPARPTSPTSTASSAPGCARSSGTSA